MLGLVSAPQNLSWFLKVSCSWVKSQVCLVVSNCVAPYLFPYFIPVYGDKLLRRWARRLTQPPPPVPQLPFPNSFTCFVYSKKRRKIRWLNSSGVAGHVHTFSIFIYCWLRPAFTRMCPHHPVLCAATCLCRDSRPTLSFSTNAPPSPKMCSS